MSDSLHLESLHSPYNIAYGEKCFAEISCCGWMQTALCMQWACDDCMYRGRAESGSSEIVRCAAYVHSIISVTSLKSPNYMGFSRSAKRERATRERQELVQESL